MATATKTARALQAAASNAAGGTTTGASFDLTTALGLAISGKIVNGATAPSVGCTFRVEVSNDGATWRTFSEQTAGTDNAGTYQFVVELGAAWMYVRTVFTGNTGQAVTVQADGHELTSIG